MPNKHGLPRHIDSETKRQIRRNSRFSCVVCRAPFCTYEHFDPEFKDASEHNPDGMCLLCPACQADTTAGRLSKAVIRATYEARRAEDQAESRRSNFLFFDRMPTVKLGESTILHSDTVICTDSIDCLSFSHDEETGTFLINLTIFDRAGQKMLEVTDNTWLSNYVAWDFEFSGKVITFRSAPGEILFRAKLDAENNHVEITHLDMMLGRSRVRIEDGDIIATRVSKDGWRAVEIGARFHEMKCRAVVFLDNRDDVPRLASEIPVLHQSFGGITIGRGSFCHLQKFSLRTTGIRDEPRSANPASTGPREAYVAGQLLTKTIHFPFWEEKEYYLNGVKLAQLPFSVDDFGECEHGGVIELFHLGREDAHKFTHESGLIAYKEIDLPRPPKRPHGFL